ncbi:MAG: O-antigen ligase family protein [Candidatus Sumerlaeia bacterium]
MNDSVENARVPGDVPAFMRQGVLILLLLFLALMHWYPSEAYPLVGLIGGMGLGTLAVVAGGMILLHRVPIRGLVLPGFFYAAFLIYAWIATRVSLVPSDGSFTLATYALGLGAFWLGAFLMREPTTIPTRRPANGMILLLFFTLLATLFSIHAILEYHFIYPARLSAMRQMGLLQEDDWLSEGIAHALKLRRVSSRFGNPNVLCGFLAMCLPMMATLAWKVRGYYAAHARLLLGIATGLLLYAAFRTASAGGILAILLAMGLIFVTLLWAWNHRRSSANSMPRTSILLIALTLCLLPNLTGIADGQSEEPAQEPTQSDGPRSIKTLEQRFFYWQSGFAMWQARPIRGHGLGAYGRLYPMARLSGAGESRYPHNFIVELAVETGLIGLGLFGGILFLLGRRFLRRVHLATATPVGLAMIGAIAIFLFHSTGDLLFNSREVFIDFSLLAGAWFAGAVGSRNSRAPRSGFLPGLLVKLSFPLIAAGCILALMPDSMSALYEQRVNDIWQDTTSGPPPMSRRMQALEYANKAMRWQPENPWLHQLRAHAYAQVGRPDAMRAELRRAAELHPTSAAIRADLARAEWQAGHREEALRLIDEAIGLHPLKSNWKIQKSQFLLEIGRTQEALELAQRAAEDAFSPLEKKLAQENLEQIRKASGP